MALRWRPDLSIGASRPGQNNAFGKCNIAAIEVAAAQALMAAVCKTYAAQVEAGDELLPLAERGGATARMVKKFI